MGIVDEDVVKVRDAVDLVALVSQYVQLKKVGRRWQGLCPFHAEKTASFSLSGENGLWKCFGCGMGGDAITFIREIEKLDFVGAVEHLAGKTGILLRYTERTEGEGRKRRGRLVDAMAEAVDWYHERLLTAPDAGPARGYLRSRGIDGDSVRAYRIGWAPDAWHELAHALHLPDDVLRDTGLGFLNRSGQQTDAFRGRVLFPIFDTNGEPVAFGGRALPGADGPKYKNSPETPLYAKSKVLYGLNWAKAEMVSTNQAVVCEGYTDVIGFAAVGIPRAVATCGTALTEEHLRLLRKFTRRVVLAFDPDAAGQAAADRFYAWERSLDLDVTVAALPTGADPADLAQRDPEALRKTVEQAVPFLGFRLERTFDGADLSSPEGRARVAEAALAVIAEHPSDLVRDQYLMEVAGRCRLDPEQLRARLRGVRPGAGAKLLPVDRARLPAAPRETVETEAIRLAIQRPADMGPWAEECLFADERHVAVVRALGASSSLHEALAAVDPGAAEVLLRVAVEESDADPDDVGALLVLEAARRALPDYISDPVTHTWVKQRIDEARPDSPTRFDAARQLLAFLVARNGGSGHE